MNRNELIAAFQNTVAYSKSEILRCLTAQAVVSSKVYPEHFQTNRHSDGRNAKISVEEGTTFAAAKKYLTAGKTAVLNFANPVIPGGGVQNGAMAQEECLCRSSNLYLCLTSSSASEYYQYHRLQHNDFNSDRLIYTKEVTVFKTDDEVPELMPVQEWFQVDVITCAAPYIAQRVYTNRTALKSLFKSRIKNIFEVAIENGITTLILGAFGCGAFKNPPEVVAAAFHEVITENGYASEFDRIVFAIKSTVGGDSFTPCPNIMAFQNEFSEAEKLHFDDSRELNQAFDPITLPSGKVLTDRDQINTFQKWKEHNPYFGKQFSILGDSISTLDGYNPDGYNLFYTGDACKKTGVYEMEDTWWGKVIDYFGGELLVNNSWSGSRVTRLPDSDKLFPSGCSNERTGSLHINNTKPDVILVYLGINDWAYGVMAGQTLKVNKKGMLLERKSAQQDESVFSFAYNKILISLRKNYPQTEIFCCTLCETKIGDQPSFQFPNSYGGTHIDVFNRIIRETAAQNGCKCLDLGYYHIPYDSMDGTHPTAAGMNTLATLIIRGICLLRNEKNDFIDCESDEHEFFTLHEYTGASEYVCRKCGLLEGDMPYPGVSPFTLKYAGSTLNGNLIKGKPESVGWNSTRVEPTVGNLITDKWPFIQKHHYPNAIDFNPEGTLVFYSAEQGITLFDEITNHEYKLCKPENTVGSYKENDLILDSHAVSGTHAVIIFDVDRWLIRDNASKYGTWLNGIRLQQEREYVLHCDDEISFSKEERFIFCKTPYGHKVQENVGQNIMGKMVAGKYKVTDRIGMGGYFSVYRAKSPDGKEVVIKLCDKQEKGVQPYKLAAILQEFQFMRMMDHPAIPKAIEIVENDRYIFMVREYISGRSLKEIVNENGTMDEKMSVRIAICLAEVLQYMHSLEPKYLYLDMKPANVILTAEHQVKLIDFGTVMQVGPTQGTLRQAIGTRGYAAPEQYDRAAKVDVRTDIYGIGATLSFMTTGGSIDSPVYAWPNAMDADTIYFKELEDIIRKCMEKDPSKRYQSCNELITDLKLFMKVYDKKLTIQNEPIHRLQSVKPAVFRFSIPKCGGILLTRIRQQTKKGEICIAKVIHDYLGDYSTTKFTYAGGEISFHGIYDILGKEMKYDYINERNETIAHILVIPNDGISLVEYENRCIFLKWEYMKPPVVRFDPDKEWGKGCDEMRPSVIYEMLKDQDLYHYKVVINGHLPEPLVMIMLSLVLTGGWG